MLPSSVQDIFTRATAPQGDASALPRALLVFAHPDDETVGLGSRLGRFGEAHMVHVTDGSPRNEQDSRAYGFPSWREYREARRNELERALRTAGVAEMSRECLEVADQEASLHMAELAERLARIIAERRPEVILTHAFEGGHPDHDACAFAVHMAAKIVGTGREPVPLIVEAPFYHARMRGTPAAMFLPYPDAQECIFELSAAEQTCKRAIIRCFTTQQETLKNLSYSRESFRVAPEYDFGRLPHTPPLLYDSFPWGMTSQRFCGLAQQAEAALRQER